VDSEYCFNQKLKGTLGEEISSGEERFGIIWPLGHSQTNGEIIYMIREMKSTKDNLRLRLPETDKIECGKQHFMTLGGGFAVATSVEAARL